MEGGPKIVIKEAAPTNGEKTAKEVQVPTDKPSSGLSATALRLYSSLCSLLTIAIFNLLSNYLYDFDEPTSGLMALTASIFSFTWYYVHGGALSRQKRAFFNEANVLDTYQKYARKYGHLYEPEAPTPGFAASSFDQKAEAEVKTLGDAINISAADPNDDKSKFDQARNEHYAGMYEHALKVQREMNLPEQSAAANLDAGFDGNMKLEEVKLDAPGGAPGGRIELPAGGLGVEEKKKP